MKFEKWPSIPRLSKERMVLTEKIDGTNACVIFMPSLLWEDGWALPLTTVVDSTGVSYDVWAQSRTRFIYPESDNFGFAKWVSNNAQDLFDVLGIGKHYGEWWGHGIQRGYNMAAKRFSLFNAVRWHDTISHLLPRTKVKELFTVPLLYNGPVDWAKPNEVLDVLRTGSYAAPTFKDPEGIVLYLREAATSYKILLKNDEFHKWQVQE